MLIYLFKRLLAAVPIALGVTVVSFLLVYIAPGDPLNAIAPADAPAEVISALRATYGLDRPLPVRYGLWLERALQGDLGASIATGRSVRSEVFAAVSNTLLLAGMAAAVGVTLGCVLGALAGYRIGSAVDRLASAVSAIGVSVPHYWLGLVLTIIFSVKLGWLPAMGAGPGDSEGWAWDTAHLRHLLLPAATLCVIPMGIITRTVRALVADTLSQEFVVSLRARGLPASRIFRHVAKNAAPTVLAVTGLQVGYLMCGSILVETVFAWPGLGRTMVSAIAARDYPVVLGLTLVYGATVVIANLLSDVILLRLDPRRRLS